MKLAIVMSGMLRNFEDTFPTTKNYLLNDDFFEEIDIFFCGYADKYDLNESILRFKKLYKPKDFLIDNWGENIENEINEITGFKDWQITNKTSNIKNVMSSWRCRFIANNLRINFSKKYNVKYDLVFNLRTDFFLFSEIDKLIIRKYRNQENCVFVPPDWDFKNVDAINIGDIMAFGSPKAMNKYYSFYLYARKYRDKKIGNHAETLLGHHFQSVNLERKYCRRIIAREYPYSKDDKAHLWEKSWPKEDFFRVLGKKLK